MDLDMFVNDPLGELVPISGQDPAAGPWRHHAFVPLPLPDDMPTLSTSTILAVTNARASLAALDSTARQLPNPTLLRLPTLRREAQSTSALEGTYAPLDQVLVADDEAPATAEMTEILNYVRAANYGYAWIGDGRPITTAFLSDLQGMLMRGTALESASGRVRDTQVVIGRRTDPEPTRPAAHNARFIPTPPDHHLRDGLEAFAEWLRRDHTKQIDPVVAAAMSHYQFETLHPFCDGNGRIGRLLIVLHLQMMGTLSEPTLTVSPWFEARRDAYYDSLFSVSTRRDWDGFIGFFSKGLSRAAEVTREEMLALVDVQAELREAVRASALRADSAHALIDVAIANPSFTVRNIESELKVSYGRANQLVGQLLELGILNVVDPNRRNRRFYAPKVLDVLTSRAAQ